MTNRTDSGSDRESGPLESDPLDDDGPAAPPRANGELVFTAPWQSRLFATTMRLWQTGQFEWDRFRQNLITQIARHEQQLADPEAYDYWGCWQRALEQLLMELDSVSTAEIDATSKTLAARTAGHDHDHGDHHEDQGHHHSHH